MKTPGYRYLVILSILPVLVGTTSSCGTESDMNDSTAADQEIELQGTIEKIMQFGGMGETGLKLRMNFGMMVDGTPYEIVPGETIKYVGMTGDIVTLDSDAVVLIRGREEGESEVEFNGVRARRIVVTYLEMMEEGSGKKEVGVDIGPH